MARIRVKRARDGYRVRVVGHLGAGDLRRLERACGPAVEQRAPALELDLTRATGMDAVSDAFVGRLAERGARIRSPGRYGEHCAAAPNARAANDCALNETGKAAAGSERTTE